MVQATKSRFRIADADRDIAFYEAHAQSYSDATWSIDVRPLYDRFLRHVAPRGLILDVGSGSGRDTEAFLNLGYRVEAIEPSPALARISAIRTGVVPCRIRVQELTDESRYDGIWACASLVHVPMQDLPHVFTRLAAAAKPSAAIYVSFKLGRGERIAADGRPFTDLSFEGLEALVAEIPALQFADSWLSEGEGAARGRDKWLNAILLKV